MTIPIELQRDRMLDSGQAAELLGYSLPHFRRLYRGGKVPKPTKIGERKLGWRAGQLVAFLDEREKASLN